MINDAFVCYSKKKMRKNDVFVPSLSDIGDCLHLEILRSEAKIEILKKKIQECPIILTLYAPIA
jgi:hypothetical protein